MKIGEQEILFKKGVRKYIPVGYTLLNIERVVCSELKYRLFANFITLEYYPRRRVKDQVKVTEHIIYNEVTGSNLIELMVYDIKPRNGKLPDVEKVINQANKFIIDNAEEIFTNIKDISTNKVFYAVDNEEIEFNENGEIQLNRSYKDLTEFIESEKFQGLDALFEKERLNTTEEKEEFLIKYIKENKLIKGDGKPSSRITKKLLMEEGLL